MILEVNTNNFIDVKNDNGIIILSCDDCNGNLIMITIKKKKYKKQLLQDLIKQIN